MYRLITGGYHDSGSRALMIISRLPYISSHWNMICYILIMNITLWISLYLWNKRCLNLQSWTCANKPIFEVRKDIIIKFQKQVRKTLAHICPSNHNVKKHWCSCWCWCLCMLIIVIIATHSCHQSNIRSARHYGGVIMGAMASQIASLASFYSTVYSGADQRKHQSSASLAFVRGIHRWPVNSPHKGPVTRNMFPFDDVIMLGSVWKEEL